MINLDKSTFHSELKQISFILEYLHTYPQMLKKLDFEDLITSDELLNHQSSWMHLYAQFEGMEKEFFKPFWMPLKRSQFDLFLDMSNKDYSVFEVNFISAEPYQYVKHIMFDSIMELMQLEDFKIDICELRLRLDETCAGFIMEHYEKRSQQKL